jgi:hypothetical protein
VNNLSQREEGGWLSGYIGEETRERKVETEHGIPMQTLIKD